MLFYMSNDKQYAFGIFTGGSDNNMPLRYVPGEKFVLFSSSLFSNAAPYKLYVKMLRD
jgi:hypothetical protein